MELDDLLDRAHALLDLGRPAEAETYAREALALDVTSAAAQVVLATALTDQYRYREAIEAAHAAVAADPDLAPAYRTLAWALVRDERADEAVEVARTAVALEPHEWIHHHVLGWALLHTRPRAAAQARDAAAQAIELDPGATPAYSTLGLALAALGDRRGGRRVMREGLRINPHDPYLHNNLAKIDLDRGLRIGRTGRHLRAAASAIPQEPVVHRNLDTLLVRFAVRLTWPPVLALTVLRLLLANDAGWWPRALTGLVLLGVIGLFVGWFAPQVPRGVTGWGRGALGRMTWPVRAIAAWLLVFDVVVLAAAFAPTAAADQAVRLAGLVLRIAIPIAIGAVVAHLVQRRRHGADT